MGSRPTARSAPSTSATVKPGSSNCIPVTRPATRAGHRADGVEAGRERPDPVERDAAPRGLEPGRAATGGRNPHRAAGVAAVRHVRLAGGHRDGRAAGGAARDAGGVERVHRGPVPLVHAGDAEGQLVQVGAADDPGPRRPGTGKAGGVLGRRYGSGRHGTATRRRLLPRHVDEVLDGQSDSGSRRLVAGDEGGHPLIVSGCRRDRSGATSWTSSRWLPAAAGTATAREMTRSS